MELSKYRECVIEAVACPCCEAEPGTACRMWLTPRVSHPVQYVHDDRSAAYHTLCMERGF